MAASLVYLITRVPLPPIILSFITLEEYGLWAVAFIFIMYIGLADSGVSNVYVRFVARFHNENNLDGINRLVSTGIITLFAIGSILLFAVWLTLPVTLELLNIPEAQSKTAGHLILGVVAIFLLDMSLGAHAYLLHGLQLIAKERKIAMISFLIEPLFILLFLYMEMGVYALLTAFLVRYLWSMTAQIITARKVLPSLQVRPWLFDRAMLRLFYGYGTAVQGSQILGIILISMDRILPATLLGPKAVALFELGGKLPMTAMSLPGGISTAAFPAAAELDSKNDIHGLSQLYIQTTRSVGLLASWPLAFLAFFSQEIAQSWLGLGEEYAWIPLLITLTAIGMHFEIITGPGSSIFRATGRVKNEYYYALIRYLTLALFVGISLLMLGVSVVSLIIGMIASRVISALIYLRHNHKILAATQSSRFIEIVLPSFYAYLAALVLYLPWAWAAPELGRWSLLALVILGGGIYTALWGVISYPRLNMSEKSWIQKNLFGRLPVWKAL
jgi:O-antigen/teichoic acid export membrane protein